MTANGIIWYIKIIYWSKVNETIDYFKHRFRDIICGDTSFVSSVRLSVNLAGSTIFQKTNEN